jgi:hypothetical protein
MILQDISPISREREMRKRIHSIFKRWAIIPVFLCLLIASPERELRADTLVRIAVWNIETVGERNSAEYNAALNIIGYLQPDVLGVNEVASSADTGNFLDLAGDANYPYTLVPGSNPFGAMRNAFMSRFPILQQAIHTSVSLSGDTQANDITRLIPEITVDVPGNALDLTLLVEHWKAGSGNDDEFRRACESLRIAQALAGRDSASEAYVVLGDVNEEIDSVPRSPNPFTSEPSGLPISFKLGQDLNQKLNGEGIPNDPFDNLKFSSQCYVEAMDALQLDGSAVTRYASNRRLDYIFLSQLLLDMNPLAEVYDSEDEGLPGGLPKYGDPPSPNASANASDHFLVFADIHVPGNPPIPEPATLLLLAVGALGVLGYSRRRRNRR